MTEEVTEDVRSRENLFYTPTQGCPLMYRVKESTTREQVLAKSIRCTFTQTLETVANIYI